MSQQHVGRFMKQCLMRQLGHWINRDLALASVSLAIAVCMRERDLLDMPRRKRLLGVPFGQRWRDEFSAGGLRQNEPVRLVHEAGESPLVILRLVLG